MSLEDFKQYIRTMAPEERHAWQYIVKRIDEIASMQVTISDLERKSILGATDTLGSRLSQIEQDLTRRIQNVSRDRIEDSESLKLQIAECKSEIKTLATKLETKLNPKIKKLLSVDASGNVGDIIHSVHHTPKLDHPEWEDFVRVAKEQLEHFDTLRETLGEVAFFQARKEILRVATFNEEQISRIIEAPTDNLVQLIDGQTKAIRKPVPTTYELLGGN